MNCATKGCLILSKEGEKYCCSSCELYGIHSTSCSCSISCSPYHFIKSSDVNPFIAGYYNFNANELAQIYQFPAPSATPKVASVFSFGGGMYGTINPTTGVLTNGDVQYYWTNRCGIPPANHPKVVVQFLGGAINNISDSGPTQENTLDVETIGACYASSNLTIILYIVPNSIYNIVPLILDYVLPNNTIGGIQYPLSNLISISWGVSEIYVGPLTLSDINSAMKLATDQGINICVATGDYGSNNNIKDDTVSAYTSFPSCSPYALAVGGTFLFCQNNIYDSNTYEWVWSLGAGGSGTGGAISRYFSKPNYQQDIIASGRSTPDIASVGDPSSGVVFYINSRTIVLGGTSVSAPTVAAFLLAANVNKFINPLLYNAPSNCFHDILTGSNGKFTAKVGYDNCSGWGSINGTNLNNFVNPLNITVVTGISFSPSSQSIYLNDILTLTPTITPTNSTNKFLTWNSSNQQIVRVIGQGMIIGAATGTATISCSSTDGSNISGSISITVTSVTTGSISISGTSSITSGTKTKLTATFTPVNTSNKRPVWTSSNTAVAIVCTNGLVIGVAAGSSTVTCTANDGSNISGSVTITVS